MARGNRCPGGKGARVCLSLSILILRPQPQWGVGQRASTEEGLCGGFRMKNYRKEGERQGTAEGRAAAALSPLAPEGLCLQEGSPSSPVPGCGEYVGRAGAGHGPRGTEVRGQGPSGPGPEGEMGTEGREQAVGRRGGQRNCGKGSGETPLLCLPGVRGSPQAVRSLLRFILGVLTVFLVVLLIHGDSIC